MLPYFTMISDTYFSDEKQSENPIGHYRKVLLYLQIKTVFKIVYFGHCINYRGLYLYFEGK